MKEIKLEIRIHSLQYDELTPQDRELMDKAKEATSRSYAPYSKFSVGAAALLKNGVIVTGTNQENAPAKVARLSDLNVFLRDNGAALGLMVTLPDRFRAVAGNQKNRAATVQYWLHGLGLELQAC